MRSGRFTTESQRHRGKKRRQTCPPVGLHCAEVRDRIFLLFSVPLGLCAETGVTLPSIARCALSRYSAMRSATLLREPMANLFELPRYIAVEGPIRVGKSTLSRILAERLNAQRVM